MAVTAARAMVCVCGVCVCARVRESFISEFVPMEKSLLLAFLLIQSATHTLHLHLVI